MSALFAYARSLEPPREKAKSPEIAAPREGLEVGTPISSPSLPVLSAQAAEVCERAFPMIPPSISGLILSLQIFPAEALEAEEQEQPLLRSPFQIPDPKSP